MTVAAISFHVSATIAVLAGLATVLTRRGDRALAGFAVAMAALLVPMVQLGATAVAAVLLLTTAASVILLGALVQPGAAARSDRDRRPIAYWILAGLGLAGFVWVVLATGSRQVVDLGQPVRDPRFGDPGALLLELGTEFVIPAMLVGLLALCAVIAAVLGLVGGEREVKA